MDSLQIKNMYICVNTYRYEDGQLGMVFNSNPFSQIMPLFYTPVEDGSYYVVLSVRPLIFRVRSITLIPVKIFS